MHLRLAERQGLLTGRHLSPVQMLGLVILNHADTIDRAKGDREALKRSLIANGNFDHEALFPDYFPKKTEEFNPEANVDYDYSGVDWKSPAEAFDEYQALMQMLGQKTGVMSGDQVAEEIEWSDWR